MPCTQACKLKTMKSFMLRTALFLGLIFSYNAGNAQKADVQKSKDDCTSAKSCCSKKETKETASSATYAAQKETVADCPLRGTPDCPFVKDCPLKGTANCTLVKKESNATYAVKKSVTKKKGGADLPPCCKKAS